MDASRGFTFVELLTVTAVAAVLLAVAVPALDALVDASRLSAASTELFADVVLTRSEAMKRRQKVVMCKSPDGSACSNGGGWEQGWIVFVDADDDARRDAGETVLRAQPSLDGSLRLTGSGSVGKYVGYAPTGSTRLAGGGFQAGTLTLCTRSVGPAGGRQIILSSSGRPRTQKVELASC